MIDPVQVVLHVGDDEHSTARVPSREDLLPEVDVRSPVETLVRLVQEQQLGFVEFGEHHVQLLLRAA